MTKIARIQAGNGANARVAGPHLGLDPPASRSSAQYYAFLSYSHKDEELADWLHRELERFHVPRSLAGKLSANGTIPKRLTPVFRDRHELAAAKDLGEEIEAALAASQYLLVLCSPDAAKSRWTNAEIETFKRSRPDGCVLAAIVAGDPFASEIKGREGEECFPPALRQKFDRRGRATGKRAEPLAADLRETGDGRRMGFLKLVAGMLGVRLDELVQRDATRRQRRLAWITGASLIGMVVASFLAIFAIQSRDSAREQRRQAEGLVAFMLGDLKDKLEPIGKLDAIDGVGSRVLAYYSKQDTSQLSDAGLLQRSKALTLMGKIAQARGDLNSADRFIREAQAGTGEALRRSPNDPQRIFEHAQNVFWRGELARSRGQRDQSDAAYREYSRLADLMVAIEPDNIRWRTEKAYGDENLGIVEYNNRKFDQAAEHFEAAFRLMQTLASLDAGNGERQKELANCAAWAADGERSRGRFNASMAFRERQIAILDRMVASKVTDVDVHRQLIIAHQAFGILLREQGQLDRSILQFRLAVAEADRLIPIEPANAVWKSFAANTKLESAKTLLAGGNNGEAVEQANAGCELAAGLRASDPDSATTRALQTSCVSMRSRLALATGAKADAIAYANRAVESAKAEHSSDWIKDRYAIASAYRLLGDAHRSAGDSEAARLAWTAGLGQLPRNVAERPLEMDERAQLLRRLDRAGEMPPLEARLAQIGFRTSL